MTTDVVPPGRGHTPGNMELLPPLALSLLGVLFPFETSNPIVVAGHAMIFTSVEILALAAAAIWFVTLLNRRRRPQTPTLVIVPALAWLTALLASTISAPDHYLLALRFSARMVAGVIVGWMCFDAVVTSRRPTWIAYGLAVGGCLVAVLGLAEALDIPTITLWLGSFKFAPTRVGEILRISSTLSYATIAAMVLELTFPILLAWVIAARRPAMKIALGVAGGLYLLALVLTLSRAGVIALGAALVVVVAAAALTKRRSVALAASGALGTLGLLAILSLVYIPDLDLRLTSESDETWYQASMSVADAVSARPGETITVPVTISNAGVKSWDALPPHAFAVGYHLYGPDREVVTYDGARTRLSEDVAAGETISVNANLMAPNRPGTYEVQWDIVQEGVTWFSWKGSPTVPTRLIVAGQPISNADTPINYVPPPQNALTVPIPGRFQLWMTGLDMLRDRPLLGVGPDNFRLMYGLYANVRQWNSDIHANNLYVELLADTGILGFVAYVWFAWRILSQSVHGLRRQEPGSLWVWRVALAASLVTWFVHGLFDYFYEFTPTYIAFSMIAGLALGMATLAIEQETGAVAHADRV